jgi:hypothetical protein
MTIRPIFAIYSPTALATLGQWLPEQYDRLNAAYKPMGIRFATDSPVVDMTGAFGGQPLDLGNAPAIEQALADAIGVQAPALAQAIATDAAFVPVYIADYLPYQRPGETDRADVHGYSEFWNPTKPYAGIYLNHDRVPGNTVLHPETGQQVATTGATLAHEFGHWFSDEKHQFTPGQSCITDPSLRGKVNYMDYDADICRGTWTPAQVANIKRLTRQRLAAGRADRIATAFAGLVVLFIGYQLFDHLFSSTD